MIEIIGKNGSGKSFIANSLYDRGYKRNVGYTTRPKRNNEIDGVDYHFITEDKFDEMLRNDEFIDYKIRNNNYYGIARNHLDDTTILVSGSSEKIKKGTGFDITKLFINCDIVKRYKRVILRKDSLNNVFSRFHLENFSYLYDFDAVFIENNEENVDVVYNIVDIINTKNPSLVSNKKFLSDRLEKSFSFKISNKLLLMLAYEEYILRKGFIDGNINEPYFIDTYYESLYGFAKENRFDSSFDDAGLMVNLDDSKYLFDYKMKRMV